MYCPYCGKSQPSDGPATCSKCEMPLAEVAVLVARHAPVAEKLEAESSASRERLVGAAAFLAIAAIPIGWGVKNSLQQEK